MLLHYSNYYYIYIYTVYSNNWAQFIALLFTDLRKWLQNINPQQQIFLILCQCLIFKEFVNVQSFWTVSETLRIGNLMGYKDLNNTSYHIHLQFNEMFSEIPCRYSIQSVFRQEVLLKRRLSLTVEI